MHQPKEDDLHKEKGKMMSQDEGNRNMEIYKLVSEHYRQDLREFWQRSSLYILSHAFLFGAFATLVSQSRVVNNQYQLMHLHDFWFEIAVALAGMALGVLGALVVSASMRWIKRWRNQMLYLDTRNIDTFHSFSMVELNEPDPQSAVIHAKKELIKADSRWAVEFASEVPSNPDRAPDLQKARELALEVLNNPCPDLQKARELAFEVLSNTNLTARTSDEDNALMAFLHNPVRITRWVPWFLAFIWAAILVVVWLTWSHPDMFDYIPK